jgi:hypothetical protein
MPTAVELTGGKLLPLEVLATLERIAVQYGSSLQVTEVDHEWIRFHVDHIPDALLLRQLEQIQSRVFSNSHQRFQLLCPQISDGKRGIFLHHLATPALQSEYLAGVWFY